MYRFTTLSICLLIFNFSFAQNQNTTDNINDAIKKASQESKLVFVNYFSTDCPSSENMKKQLQESDLKTILNSDYIVVDIEVPKEETSDYVTCTNPMKAFGGSNCEEIKFPFWYILNDLGEQTVTSFKDNNIGFSYTEKNITDFIGLIKSISNSSKEHNDDYETAKIASK